MGKRPFGSGEAYRQSVRGLHRLHALAAAGKDDGPEADAVRASLEGPWALLSDTEKKRITGLSEDLYTISQPPRQAEPMNPQAPKKLIEAYASLQAGDWDRVLELLRLWGRFFEPALVSYLRGAVWMEAGDPATAALFFEHAAQLDPADENYASAHLDALFHSAPAVALDRACRILAADRAHPALVVVRASEIRLSSTRGMSEVDARPVFVELISVLTRTLQQLQGEESRQPSTCTMVLFLIGCCYDHLGDSSAALRYYNLSLACDPMNPLGLVARGILRYGADPAAVNDLEQAIHLGSPVVWPYFFLAHHYLVNNRFEDCRRMCERALGLPASNVVKACLHEWLAIAQWELGFPADRVRSEFEAALRLEPTNDRIERNFQVFEQQKTRGTGAIPPWDKPRASVVRGVGRVESRLALAA